MKNLLFVVNPRSGKEQLRTRLLDIIDLFNKYGYKVTIHITQDSQDASQVVRECAQGQDLLVCSGGDGTLNEVVSGLMSLDRDCRPPVGYIPSGSTNDYASSLALPKKLLSAAQTAVAGKPFPVDVGQFGAEKYFVYVAAFGAFTEVSYSTPQETKNLLGHQAYMLEAVKRIPTLKSYAMRFEWEGKELEEEFILGLVTNTISIGGFKGLVGLDVALDDGEFEVLLIRRPRTPRDIASIASYLVQKEGENDCVYQFRAKNLHICSQEPVDWSLDGEYGGSHKEILIENRNRAVTLLTEAPPDIDGLTKNAH